MQIISSISDHDVIGMRHLLPVKLAKIKQDDDVIGI